MTESIPASAIVNVNPNVIAAGGTALDLNGLLLTTSAQIPIGSVLAFSTPQAVAAYFGAGSSEAAQATVYFAGFTGSNVKPAAMLFAQYNTSAVAPYLRGATLGMTLAQLKAVSSGIMTVTVDGSLKTSSSINLSGATSFSNAATIIQTAFSGNPTVTYDSVSGAFVLAGPTTGASGTITYAGGTIATALKLTAATGAVLSQGAAVAVPGTFMDAVAAQSQNWASFATLFEPSTDDKVLFASWTNGQDNRYAYVMWDDDVNATLPNDTTTAGHQIIAADYSGTVPVYTADATKAVFVMGMFASIDFNQLDGRITAAFKSQSGLTADVTDQTIAAQLITNGYNYYGAYGTANDQFLFFYPGTVTGAFTWADTYINQVWLNNALQLALMQLLTSARSIPYNQSGYGLIQGACADPINAGVLNGVIRPGVTLSAAQIAEINGQAGLDVATTVSQRGWYFQILDASPEVRAARGSPPMTLWYADGGSVQSITLASLAVQ